MTAWPDIAAAILLGLGAFFTLTGALGLLRFPDFYTRLHPAGIKDALGAPLILSGLILLGGMELVSLKIVLLILFLMITSPTSTHALAKSALSDGHLPLGSIDADVDVRTLSGNATQAQKKTSRRMDDAPTADGTAGEDKYV